MAETGYFAETATRRAGGAGAGAVPSLALVLSVLVGCTGLIEPRESGDDDAAATGADSGPAAHADAAGEATADAPVASIPDAGSDAVSPADADLSALLFAQDFDDSPLGTYTRDSLDADWRSPPWENGIDEGRLAIVEGSEAYSGRSLRVLYPQGGVGPGEGGAQWRLELGSSYDELFLSYRVRFGAGFDFVRGGKLPGLVGGAANTGGDPPDGTDGWSARMMWRVDGAVVQYLYHPDQPGTYGEDLSWEIGGERFFEPGQWHQVEHRIVMNTPGEHDGLVEGWFDGVLALRREGIRFRDVDSFSIDALYFSTFFGGSDETWAATSDEYVYFDDFVISTQPIAH